MITLRNATINDLALLELWDEQPHNIASDPNDDWEWQAELVRNPDLMISAISRSLFILPNLLDNYFSSQVFKFLSCNSL